MLEEEVWAVGAGALQVEEGAHLRRPDARAHEAVRGRHDVLLQQEDDVIMGNGA